MDDEQKIVKIGAEARESVRKAVKIVGEAVCRTLGPKGRNALIDRGRNDRSPLITNDGKTIAKSIRLQGKIKIADEEIECDETVDKVAHVLFEVAKRTDEDAGDGTTTSITLARAIVEECLEHITDTDMMLPGSNRRSSPMALAAQLEEEKNKAVGLLKEMSEPVTTLDQLKDIAFTSLENKEAADIVATAMFQIGKDGFATVEEGYEGKIEAETIPGIQIYAKAAASFMYTNDKRRAIFLNAPVLVTNATLATLAPLQGLLSDMGATEEAKRYNTIVIMASKFEAPALKQIFRIYEQSMQKSEGAAPFRILAIKVPSLTDEELEDVAAYLDAQFINTDVKVGGRIEKARFKDLGFAERIDAGDDQTVITGGRGLVTQVMKKDEEPMTRVAARLQQMRETLTIEHDEMFKNKLTRRIEILSGGVAVLRVGAQTDTEKSYLKLKVEDAKNACKCALQEGMVPGGGMALSMIADKLGEDQLLSKALKAPGAQIIKNAGSMIDIPDTIKDPTKVVRCALENAVSVAKILITTETIVADKRLDMGDELKNMMGV